MCSSNPRGSRPMRRSRDGSSGVSISLLLTPRRRLLPQRSRLPGRGFIKISGRAAMPDNKLFEKLGQWLQRLLLLYMVVLGVEVVAALVAVATLAGAQDA